MLDNFQHYFVSIEMPQPIIDKANQLCIVYADVIGGPIEDVFVSDVFEEGTRRYKSLWLKSGQHIFEAKEFVSAHQLDLTPRSPVEYLELSRNDLTPYDQGTTPQTTLEVTVRFRSMLEGRLHGVHNNCPHLYRFAVANFRPHE